MLINIDMDSFPSINTSVNRFKYAINSDADGIMSAAKGYLCLASGIFGILSNPASLIQGLKNVAIGLSTAIVGVATKILTDRANDLINSVLSPIRLITNFIKHMTAELISIQSLIYDIEDKAKNLDSYFKERQNCDVQAANFMNCLTQSLVNKLTNKVAKNLDKNLSKIVKDVDNQMRGVNGTINKQIKKYGKFVDKVNNQTKFLI